VIKGATRYSPASDGASPYHDVPRRSIWWDRLLDRMRSVRSSRGEALWYSDAGDSASPVL
jgi:hypothetical protein